MADLTVAQRNAALEAMFPHATGFFLSLHTADPGTTGASEVTGGSYARQALSLAAASGGSQVSTNTQTFTGMPAAGGNLFAAIWSLVSGGTYLGGNGGVAVTGPITAGATITFATGNVTTNQS